MQFSVGLDTNLTGDPSQITWSNGVGPNWVAGMRAIRMSLMTRTARTIVETNGTVVLNSDTAAQSLEDHVVALPPDGFRRTLYTRRVDLVNMAAENL
jgi:hypothetical protein